MCTKAPCRHLRLSQEKQLQDLFFQTVLLLVGHCCHLGCPRIACLATTLRRTSIFRILVSLRCDKAGQQFARLDYCGSGEQRRIAPSRRVTNTTLSRVETLREPTVFRAHTDV